MRKQVQITLVGFILLTLSVLLPYSTISATASSTSAKVDTAKIDAFVESMIKQLHIPGAALGILKGDQIVHLKGYGTSGPNGESITPQTPFVIGSTSKSFTALAIMQLVEQGKVDLNAPVRQYLPDFQLADPKAAEGILVKDLLHHVSGFSTLDGRRAFDNRFDSIDDLTSHLKNVSLSDKTGSTYHYSNLNYDLLGEIIQAVSGQSYAEYVQEHIFNPLQMKNSFTSVPEAQQNGLARGYQSIFGFMLPTDTPNIPSMLASAYIISSAEDMTHYLIAQLNNGTYQNTSIASPASISAMHQPAVKISPTEGYYGMGWEVKDGYIHHDGDVKNYHSDMILDDDFAVVVLINSHDLLVRGMNFTKIATGVAQIMHGQEPTGVQIPNVILIHSIIDLICMVVLVLIIWAIYRLFKWKKTFTATPLRITITLINLFIFNIILPAGILILVGNNVTWSLIFAFLPGVGHFMFIASILLLGIGAVKSFLLIRSWISRTTERSALAIK